MRTIHADGLGDNAMAACAYEAMMMYEGTKKYLIGMKNKYTMPASTLSIDTSDDNTVAWMLVNLRRPRKAITKAVGVDGQTFEVDDMVFFPSPPNGLNDDGVVVSFQDKDHAVVRYHYNAWSRDSKYHVLVPVIFLVSKNKKYKGRKKKNV